ncbi:MAG: hypothetical protein IJT79_05140 [Ruminococcus sp.]|nr:hypothetical protein [Ruminococcus sp.]
MNITERNFMSLKEGFCYQNYLNSLMSEAENYLFFDEHLFKTTKTHKRKAANPEAEDFIEEVASDNPFSVDDILAFMEVLITEKEGITAAINEAKASADQDIDALTEGNKLRNAFNKTLKNVLKKKGKTTTKHEHGYMLNNEKNQVSYYYEVEETKEELFKRKKLVDLFEKSSKKSADTSNQIDALRVTTPINYNPRFNVNLTFEEELVRFTEADSKNK